MMLYDLFAPMTTERKRFNAELKQKLYDAQGGKCMFHGGRVTIDLMDIDHKNPLSRGGSNRTQNLQILCRTCNGRKGDKTNREFRQMYKATGIPQTQVLPAKSIPQKAFEEVGKAQTAVKRKRQAKAKNDNPFGLF